MSNLSHQNTLHLSLQTCHKIPGISKHQFIVKPTLIQQRYADLDLFRQQVELSKAGLHHQPYTSNKKNTYFYKMTFLSFAALFFLLDLVTMSIPSALGCGFFFSSCTFLKGIVVSFCTVLSLSSLTIGLKLKPEKEIIAYYMRKTKARLATIYARKRIRLGLKGVFFKMGVQRQTAAALKQLHQEICDKINDKKDETLHLVHRISTAETLDLTEKDALLNQAIEEFNDKLHFLTDTFKHATLPHLG